MQQNPAVNPKRKALGRVQKSYHGQTVSWSDFFLWVFPGVLIPIVFLCAGTLELLYGDAQEGLEARDWFLLAALSLLPFALLAFRRFNSAGKSVFVHENGLRLLNIAGQNRALLWSEIQGVRFGGAHFHLFGLPVSDKFALSIQPAGGDEIHIPARIDRLPDLVERIKQHIYPLRQQELAKALAQDQRLDFGAVRIDRRHLETQGKTIPWWEVRSLKIESGTLAVETEKLGNIKIPTGEILNIELFMKLVDESIEAQ